MTETSSYTLSSGAIRMKIADLIGRIRGTSIKARSARAVMTLGIGTVAGRSMRLLKNMILAKFLLASDQIGIMVIIMSFSVTFEALIEVGVKQSIIQNKRGANAEYLNVAWWMQVARGLCLFVVASLLAPWIGSFYDTPELSKLLQVAFFAVVFRCLVSPRAYVLEKEFKFGRAAFLVQGSAILGAIITVGLALVMRNVWALVFGFVAEMAIMCVLSFILVPFRPRFRIDRESLSDLLHYARRMVGLPMLTAISLQSPVLVLGKVTSKSELGLYSLAYVLAYIPVDLYQRIVAPVLLPAFSKKQDDNRALCRGILQTAQWTALLAIPLVAFMVCSGSELLLIAWTAEYAAMAMVFAVLCLQILICSQSLGLGGIYLATGQHHLQRRFAVVRALLVIGLIYPAAVRFGPLGVAVVIILGHLVLFSLQIITVRRVINLDLGRYLRSYIPGLLVALPIILTFDLLWVFGIDSLVLVLAIGTSVFIVAFVAGVFVLNRCK